MFSCKRTIYLRDTDATGVLFFTEQFRLVLEVLETFFQKQGFSLREMIEKKVFLMPIVHAESDYFSPLYVGDTLTVHLSLEKIGTSSFTLVYHLFDELEKEEKGRVSIVHVIISRETCKSIPIPKELKKHLLLLATTKDRKEPPGA